MLTKVNEHETVIEELQSEVLRDNEYVEPQINVQVAYLSDKIEPADVVGLPKNNLSSVNMLANVSRKCAYIYIYNLTYKHMFCLI